MNTSQQSAHSQNLIRLQKNLRSVLVELSINWQILNRQEIILQILDEWQSDYREGEAERYAADRVKAVQWLSDTLDKRLAAEKSGASDWQTVPVSEGEDDPLDDLSSEALASMPVEIDATLDLLGSIELPSDSDVLQKRLAHYAQQATKRLSKVTQELNANLEKTDLELQKLLQTWHATCQTLLSESEGDREASESIRIHALLAMSAENYLYWQRMVAEDWQPVPESEGGMPAYHLTAKNLADRAEQSSLLAGQCLQDIMLNWFRIGTANQDTLMDWLSSWSSSFAMMGCAMETPTETEQLEYLADELDRRSSRMRREIDGWVNFGPGQRLPGMGIPYEIREVLETIAAAREKAVRNASADLEIQRLYESCRVILPGLHEFAKNLQAITDDNDADELESWIHLQMNGFIRLSKVSRSHAARAAGLFADILDERIDLERDIRTDWLRLNKKEWDAAQPPSAEKAGLMMGQIILKIGKIRHHTAAPDQPE